MKIYDLEYLFFKSVRNLRSPYSRSRIFQKFNLPMISRIIATLALLLLASSASPLNSETVAVGTPVEEPALVHDTAEISPESQNIFVNEVAETGPQRIVGTPDIAGVTARSAAVKDLESGKNLFEQDIDASVPPASITKVMTAFVALRNFDLNDTLTVPQSCTVLDGNNIGLEAGAELTVQTLLTQMLVFSASDSTCTLASYYTEMADFVAAMNLQAQALDLEATAFDNPIGLDSTNQRISARDALILGEKLMEYDIVREIVVMEEIQYGDGIYENTNELLGEVPGLIGVKTGFTYEARECLLFAVERDGRGIMGVVLGSEDRFGEARELIEWVYASYDWSD